MTVPERTSSPAPTVPTPHRWTVEDYLRADEAGAFANQKVELIEGEIIDMPAQNVPHMWTLSRLNRELVRMFPEPFWLKIQGTQILGNRSAPEPDFVVLSGPPADPAGPEPAPLLVIEVSASSLDYDRGRKARLYAGSGIPEYWVVDVDGKQVEVSRDPESDRYRQIKVYRIGDHLTPLAQPNASVALAAFLS